MWCVAIAIVCGILTMVSAEASFNFCLISPNHSSCRSTTYGPKCAPSANAKPLNDAEKAQILKLHNDARQKVASGQQIGKGGFLPSACDIKELEWDDEIAGFAQDWVNNCDYGHDYSHPVGQNVGQIGYSPNAPVDVDYEKTFNLWYSEARYFGPSDIHRYRRNSIYGHFSQVIWANTKYVGCGAVEYPKGRYVNHFVVCNYKPAGNFLTREVYRLLSSSCSGCPSDTSPSPNYFNLCV